MSVKPTPSSPRFAVMVAGAGAASIAVRAIGLVKELIVAPRFGTGDAIEAFLMALAVPLLVSSAYRSAILSSFVPRFIAARERDGREAASRLLAASLARHAILAGATAAALALLAHPIVLVASSGFPQEKRALTEHLFVLLSVLVFVDGLAAVWSSALQAEGRIVLSTLGLAGSPLVTLVVLMASHGPAPELLVLGSVGGAVAEAAWAAACLAVRGWSPISLGHPWAAHARAATSGFAKLLVGSAILAINPIVDQAMATRLGSGSVAELGYGGRIVSGILGILAMAFGTAALPRYSMYVASGDTAGLFRAYRRDSLVIVALGAGIALALIAVSTPVTRLLYERGAFTAADTENVARVQAFCAVQLPGYLFGILGSRILSALGREWEMLAIASAGALLNVAGNIVLSRWLGVAGIALSTGIVYAVTAAAMAFVVRRARPA